MKPWFRLYNEVLDDPKVQRLDSDLFKFWINTLCLASRHDGLLPPISDVSFAFRVTLESVTSSFSKLIEFGLLDETKRGLKPHRWNRRQFKSDTSAERMRRHRERHGDVTVTSRVTPPEQIQNRPEQSRSIEGSPLGTNSSLQPNTPIKPLCIFCGEFENVKLTENEQSQLIQRFGQRTAQDRINTLSEYLASTGKKYKSHYATILAWERRNANGRYKTKADRTHEAAESLLADLYSENSGIGECRIKQGNTGRLLGSSLKPK